MDFLACGLEPPNLPLESPTATLPYLSLDPPPNPPKNINSELPAVEDHQDVPADSPEMSDDENHETFEAAGAGASKTFP